MGLISSIPSSFRDPSGNLFMYNDILYRRISYSFKENYDHLMNSGLYNELCSKRMLIAHEEVSFDGITIPDTYKIIKPEKIDFISYPFEWCFSQLKDAALLTLKIQKISLKFGMSLKDSSAYNIQFKDNKPIFIDTLSFERYKEAKPWVAYRQFCQHFFAPLALMSLKDMRLNQLLRIYIDGIPIDLASKLLPIMARFNLGVFMHLHLHAKTQKRFEDRTINRKRLKMNLNSLNALIEHLESSIKRLQLKSKDAQWYDYYEKSSYSQRAKEHKLKIILNLLDRLDPGIVMDLGANDGFYSRLIAKKAKFVVSIDADGACVEKNYGECKKGNHKNVLPLLVDLANPSPAIGWDSMERQAFLERFRADTIFALALIHHLAISNNIPLDKIADFLSNLCSRFLIIEFVPKTDSQVKRLLSSREDIFSYYRKDAFEQAFLRHFVIKDKVDIVESERTIYLMERKN